MEEFLKRDIMLDFFTSFRLTMFTRFADYFISTRSSSSSNCLIDLAYNHEFLLLK